MPYSAISADFLGLLNRNDCTTAQVQTFVTQALARILQESEGRLSYLEREQLQDGPFGQSTLATPVAVEAAGSGYPASSTFSVTVSGGTATRAAVVSVSSDANGAINKVNALVDDGLYTAPPSSPAATTAPSGTSGTGLTLSFLTTPAPFNSMAVPDDLEEIIDLITPDMSGRSRPLLHLPHRTLLRMGTAYWPTWYSRYNGVIYWRGNTPLTQRMQLLYYGSMTALAVDGSGNYLDTAENELTSNVPLLVVYGALSYAGDQFRCDQTDKWEARYQQLLGAEIAKTVNLDFEGGPMQVQPAYGDDASEDFWHPLCWPVS